MSKFLWGLVLLSAFSLWPQAPRTEVQASALRNPAFAEGEVGKVPKGWAVPKPSTDAGFKVELIEDKTLPGKRAAVIFRESGSGAFGNLMQTLDATPYRGKRIRLRTQLRTQSSAGATGQLWLRVDLPENGMGFFDNMGDRPVHADAWSPAEIVGDVAPGALNVALGVMLTGGNGRVWIAPVTLEILGDTPKLPLEGPKPLTARGLHNLSAFAKAFSYVRFFNPSDEAARAEWDRLAIQGVKAVEGAQSAPELAERLNRFFTPYAPSAQFLVPGTKPRAWSIPAGATQAVRWKHVGFGQPARPGAHSAYRSTREYLPLKEAAGKGWSDPAMPALLDLGGGLRLALPLVGVADRDQRTLPSAPKAPALPSMDSLPKPTAGAVGNGDDRATRLADVVLAWGIFRHFYPYFDVVKTDWEAELPRALRRAAVDKDGEAFSGTLKKLVAALHDGHGGAWGREAATAVPAVALCFVDGWPVVQFTGPGAQAIPPGSRLLSIDGEAVEARMERLKAGISAATRGWLESRLASELLGGPRNGPPAILVYSTPDGRAGKASLPRDAYPYELAGRNPLRPAPLAELRPGIWFVDLDRVQEKDFNEALPKLAAAKGVIFDLRGYPKMGPAFLQHLTDKPLQSARWNIPIVTQPDGKGWDWITSGRWNLEPRTPRITGKIAFLTGGGAISYAESCLGIVEAYKLAEIVGSPSAGTNGNINPFTLPGGYQVNWTGMKVLKHDGSQHHGVGILPTIPVKPTVQGLAAGKDEVLEAGLEAVSR